MLKNPFRKVLDALGWRSLSAGRSTGDNAAQTSTSDLGAKFLSDAQQIQLNFPLTKALVASK